MNPKAVYIWKWPGEKEYDGLALGTHMRNGHLGFHDTDRGHGFPGKVIRDTEDGFTFQCTGDFEPGNWEFRLLTIEMFKREYWKLVQDGEVLAVTIKTTEDLHEWYRNEFL